MSYSKPIWIAVTSCKYKNSPSFGAVNDCKMEVRTGSSSSNSHELGTIEVAKKVYDEMIVFNLYLDGKLIKQNVHLNNKDRAGDKVAMLLKNFVNSENSPIHPIGLKIDKLLKPKKK